MPKILVIGPSGNESQFRLSGTRTLRIGRRPALEDDAQAESVDLGEVSWESSLSRNHAELSSHGDGVRVVRHPDARNPLFFKGETSDAFVMGPGEHFVVGDTTFHFIVEQLKVEDDDPTPVDMGGFSPEELQQTRYRDADERIEVLASLPDLLRGANDDQELFARLVMLMLQGVPSGDAVAVVGVESTSQEKTPGSESGEQSIEVFYWEGRDMRTAELRPSRRLIQKAIDDAHTVRSLWTSADERLDFTMAESMEWAFCTPVPGTACAGWAIYVAGGRASTELDLRPDVKFTELVASFLGAMRDFQGLQHQQSVLGRFFSPVALPMLSSPEGEKALEPRQTEVTVLFCDLRGFSRTAEQEQDNIIGLLARVSQALDVMTQAIHAQQGVLCDFQGDAALAFWGWPIDDDGAALNACRAALAIRSRFSRAVGRKEDPLFGFSCGIGLASGKAVAGRLGTAGRFKIDVFGPVVNLASRLEGITKQLRVPILVDGETTERLSRLTHSLRFRRLAHLRPYGMDKTVVVSELMPPSPELVTDAARRDDIEAILDESAVGLYESALDAFVSGDWEKAFEMLHEVPHWDRGKDFLTSHILRHGRTPPEGWDGVVTLERK